MVTIRIEIKEGILHEIHKTTDQEVVDAWIEESEKNESIDVDILIYDVSDISEIKKTPKR